METGRMKLALSAGALALSMALAGCGGSSSSGGGGPISASNDGNRNTTPPPQFDPSSCKDGEVANAANDACIARVTSCASEAQEPNAAGNACVDKPEPATASLADARALYKALRYASTGTIGTDGKLDIVATGVTPVPSGLLDLEKQDKMAATAMAKLGNWNGADYKKVTGTGTAQITAEARVYSNQATATNVAFTSRSAGHELELATGDDVTGDVYTVPDAPQSKAMLDSLETAGLKTLTDAEKVSGLKGSFAGASGTYKCTGETCTAAPVTTGGVDFSTGWTFTPDTGAMVAVEDDDYLRFGWWVRKDRDGATHASAFYGRQGDPHEDGNTGGQSDGSMLPGSAKYNGKAVGKFAIRHGDTANAGHFTADAEIIAKFGSTTAATTTTNGLTGTIDKFQLNDGTDPGWSVSLKRAGWNGTDNKYELSVGTTAARENLATKASGTAVEWSIDDSAAPAQTGQWEAQLFDEKADDGTNAPTTVVGKFEAGFGDTHKMVGAFGATQTQ